MKEGLTKYWYKIEEIKEKHLNANFECEAMTKPVAISYSKLGAISYFNSKNMAPCRNSSFQPGAGNVKDESGTRCNTKKLWSF